MNTDRIEKSVVLRAPGARVWRALSDPEEFGRWFGARLDGQFTPGARVVARITTPGYDHLRFKLVIEAVEPEVLPAYRWHPYAVDPSVDYSGEPMTRVEFRLPEVADGTALTVVESGFHRIPAARRAEAFRMNQQGWAEQVVNLENYLAADSRAR